MAEGRGIEVEMHTLSDMLRTVHLARLVSDLQYGWDREPALELGDGWQDLR